MSSDSSSSAVRTSATAGPVSPRRSNGIQALPSSAARVRPALVAFVDSLCPAVEPDPRIGLVRAGHESHSVGGAWRSAAGTRVGRGAIG